MINNRPVITENSISNRNTNIINNNNPDIQVDDRKIHFHPCPIQVTNQILLEQTHELVLKLEILKFGIYLLNGMWIACEGGWKEEQGE